MRARLQPLRFLVCCCMLSCLASAAPSSASRNPRLTGTPFLSVWRTEDFGGSPVNWRVAQHPNGLVYVGNNFGVLEFDGASWRLLPMPSEGAARALIVDTRGRLWAAGNGEIATLEPDAAGRPRLVDRTPRLAPADRVFGVLNRALATPAGVFLSGDRRIFLFRPDGAVASWSTAGDFSAPWALDDAVYVARDGAELLRLLPDGGATVVARFSQPDQPLLRTYAATRVGRDRLLLTRDGPVLWPENAAHTTPLSAASAALFRDVTTRGGFVLSDGRMLFATVRGALMLSASGELLQHFDKTHGLPVDTINGFCEDAEGGVWLALQNGLVRLQADSAFAQHGMPQGLESGPRRLTLWRDRLYVAHGSGVSWRDPADGTFHAISALSGGANRPVVVNDRLLVSTASGVKEITPENHAVTWTRQNAIALLASKRAPGWLFSGDSDGLSLLAPTPPTAEHPRGGWRVEGRLQHLPANVVQIHDSDDGFVWIVGNLGDVWRIDFRAGLRLDAPCQHFAAEQGVPPARRRDHVQIFSLGDDIVAAGKKWLLRFDAQQQRFAPAASALGGLASADAFDLTPPHGAWLHVDEPDSTVLRVDRSAPGAPWQVERFPAPELNGLILNSIFHDERTRTLWIAGQGSLISMDLARPPTPPRAPLRVQLRQAETRDGELLFAGSATPPHLRLSADQNSLRLEFAAATYLPDYQGRLRTLFRTRVVGLDREWSPWSAEPYRDLTNLPFRELVFEVQARSLDGRNSPPLALGLSVTPPWWLTRWAFAGAAVILLAALAAVVLLRTRALRRRAERLEQIVATRTAELAAQNSELARLRQLETEEKIAARLAAEKAQLEVLRYQLNPHFLFNALNSIYGLVCPHSRAAGDLVRRLSDFCRHTLTRSDDDWRPLAEEFVMLRNYLDLEQARWRDGLSVEISVHPEVSAVAIPAFLLLPLVENAIKHGSATSPRLLTVRLRAVPAPENAVEIEVANTGAWRPSDLPRLDASTGIGLENLHARLARCFPDAHRLAIDAADGWVAVKLHLSPVASPALTTTPPARVSAPAV